jgi:hypothetical protein
MLFAKAVVLFALVVSSAYGADLNWGILYLETIPALNRLEGPQISLKFQVDLASDSSSRWFETTLLTPDCLAPLDVAGGDGLTLSPNLIDASSNPAVLMAPVDVALTSLSALVLDTLPPAIVGGLAQNRIRFCLRLQVCPGNKADGLPCVPMNIKQVIQTTTFTLPDDFNTTTTETIVLDPAENANINTTLDAQLDVYWCDKNLNEVTAPQGPFNANSGIYTFCVTSNNPSVIVQSIESLEVVEDISSNVTVNDPPVTEVLVANNTILTPYYTIVDCSTPNICRVETNVKFEFYVDANKLFFEGQAYLKVGVARNLRRQQEESIRTGRFSLEYQLEKPSSSSATALGVVATFLVLATSAAFLAMV